MAVVEGLCGNWSAVHGQGLFQWRYPVLEHCVAIYRRNLAMVLPVAGADLAQGSGLIWR